MAYGRVLGDKDKLYERPTWTRNTNPRWQRSSPPNRAGNVRMASEPGISQYHFSCNMSPNLSSIALRADIVFVAHCDIDRHEPLHVPGEPSSEPE